MHRIWARLKEHWIRHLLAALQVAVGVAVIAAVFVDVVPVLRERTRSRTAEVFSVIYGGSSGFGQFRSSAFTVEDVAYLEEEADAVVAASVYENTFVSLARVDGDLYMLRGLAQVSPGFAELVDMRLVAGRFFDAPEAQRDEPEVIVISKDLAEVLFPGQDPIGQVINLRPDAEARRFAGFVSPFTDVSTEGNPGLDVRVIGVFEYPEETPSFSGFFSDMARAESLIPATGRISRTLSQGEIVQPPGEDAPVPLPPVQIEYSQLFFRAAPGMGASAVAEVEALLQPRIEARLPAGRAPDDLPSTLIVTEAMSGTQMLRQAQMRSSLLLGAMGVAALIVSGVSIFTTFLASVAERVKAVGLARALGATRLQVLREVVGEAVALSAFGGILGVALAFPVRFAVLIPLMSGLAEPPALVDYVMTIVLAMLLAIAVGAVASLYPGWTVARMMPGEAFYEE